MISESEAHVDKAAHAVEAHTREIEGFLGGIAEKAKHAFEALAVFETLKEAFTMFSNRESSVIRLTAAIEAQGRAAGPVVAQYQKLAEEISHHTLTTKDEVLALAKQAEQMGFTGEKAKALIEDSIGLGTALEMGTEHAMMLTIALERGNVQMLRRIPALRGIKDESKLVAQAELLMQQGQKTAAALSNTTAGQMTHLGHEVHALFMDLGGLVAKGLNPLIAGLRGAVEWVKNLSIVNTLVAAMQGPWNRLKVIVGETWDWAKQKGQEFIEYVQPITDALVSLWDTAWPMIKEGASELWDFITDAWQTGIDTVIEISDVLGINWKEVWDAARDIVQTAIIFMEFSLKNFKAEANLVWTGIAAGLMEAVDFMKDGFISLVATGAGVGASLLLLFTQLWDAIKHPSKAAFKNIGTGLTKTFTDAFDNMAHDLGAGESPLTKQLKEDYEKQKGILSQSFEDFKKQKLAEFALNDEYDDEEETKKEKAAKHDEHRRQAEFKALAKFDQALSNSAEAQARIAEQKDRLDPKYRGNNFDKSQKPEGSVAGSTRGSAESLKKMDESKELLRQIVKNTSKSGDTTKLEPANLGW